MIGLGWLTVAAVAAALVIGLGAVLSLAIEAKRSGDAIVWLVVAVAGAMFVFLWALASSGQFLGVFS